MSTKKAVFIFILILFSLTVVACQPPGPPPDRPDGGPPKQGQPPDGQAPIGYHQTVAVHRKKPSTLAMV